MFVICSKIICEMRRYLDDNGYFEVEIFMMYVIVGGVFVCFFIIYYNVLDMELYMCIVIELYLKCFIVGGLEKVYEIGCVFCNEGVLICYNFEFMMIELYEVYVDYKDIMKLIEDMVVYIVKKVLGIIII